MAIHFPSSTSMPLIAMSNSRASDLSSSAQMSSNVKIGGLWKRSQGVSRFTKPNYKHRVFILTEQALSYYAGTVDRVGQMKGRIPLDTVRAVEFVDVSAYNLAHSMQVVYVSKKSGFTTLYIIATTKEECSDWVATLRQACYFNRDMLMHYHPGAFIRNKWTCCLQHGRTILGCQPTYHLLTRSSSRYAQMRRKDTLTSSTNSQRRARAGSRGSHAYSDRDRRSIPNAVLTDVEDALAGHDTIVERSPAQGLSNSYLELAMHPHVDDIFTLSSPPGNSRRSSKNSTEHSTGVGSMVLTHTSISEIPPGTGRLEERENETRQRSNSQSQIPKRGRMGGRSQVAPTWPTGSPVSSSLPQHRHSFNAEHNTLPRSFKTTTPGLSNSWNHTQMVGELERTAPVGEEKPRPIPPPRLKKTTSQRSPLTTRSRVHGSQAPSPHSPSRPITNGLRHSKTFTHPHGEALRGGEQYMQAKTCGFSQSMGTLAKPLIEPKISMSNPNVIHV